MSWLGPGHLPAAGAAGCFPFFFSLVMRTLGVWLCVLPFFLQTRKYTCNETCYGLTRRRGRIQTNPGLDSPESKARSEFLGTKPQRFIPPSRATELSTQMPEHLPTKEQASAGFNASGAGKQ